MSEPYDSFAAAPSSDSSGFDLGDVGGFFVGVGEGAWALGEGVVDIGSWAVRSATDPSQRELNRQVASYIWDNPGEAAGAVWSGITDPIAQDWQSGNQGEAIGRAVFSGRPWHHSRSSPPRPGRLARPHQQARRPVQSPRLRDLSTEQSPVLNEQPYSLELRPVCIVA